MFVIITNFSPYFLATKLKFWSSFIKQSNFHKIKKNDLTRLTVPQLRATLIYINIYINMLKLH